MVHVLERAREPGQSMVWEAERSGVAAAEEDGPA